MVLRFYDKYNPPYYGFHRYPRRVMCLECHLLSIVTIGFLVIEFFHAYAQKNTIFHVESLDQQSVNATSSPLVTRKQLLLVLDCNSHLSCPFV